MRKEIRRAASVVVVAVVMAAAVPAFASHFRASFGSVSYNSTTATLTWQIEEAWRVARDDTFVEVGHTAAVTDYPAGTSTCTGLTVNSAPVDTSNPLFTRVSEMMSGSLSCLGAGQYQVYAANSARIGGVFNTSGNSRFSQAIRFTKHANGTVDLPPMFNNPTLYVLLTASGPGDLLTIDFRATDPEGQAVTYAALTDPASPDYGATALPCSTLVNGVLQIGPSLCVGAENFATDYPADRFYAAKVRAFDPAGNSAEVDSLIHVPGPPVPRVISDDGHGPTTFTVVAPDTIDPTAWTLTCTDQGDASVVAGTAGAGHEALITLALTPGHTYRCVPDATSALGSGTGTYYEIVATDHLPTPTVQTAAGDETTTFHVTQPTAGITTPTSWTVTCTTVRHR